MYTLVIGAQLLAVASARAYTWPNHLVDELEHILIDSFGYNNAGLYQDVTPCSVWASLPHYGTGRQTAAQWMRVSFHDFSTADVAAGTGGLDASIAWETDREENSGDAMNTTMGNLAPFVSKYTSMADMIALGTTAGTAACGGPPIPYKGGRIDALEAGPYGVPEPQQDLQTHLNRFKTSGFDQTGAIQLTACGHSIGHVHHEGFPTIVPPDAVTSNNTQGGVALDDTNTVFDNHIATNYLNGTSTNPLIVGFNDTNNSDKRIFESDGNTTIKDLATSEDTWNQVCTRVFTQMLNTVPKGVTLQDVVPQDVKPVDVRLSIDSKGNLTFQGAIRLLGTTFPASDNRTVTVSWGDSSVHTTSNGSLVGSSTFLNADTYYHLFSASIDPAVGIGSFTVTVHQDGTSKTYDNGGQGYPVDDGIMWLPNDSSFVVSSNADNSTAMDLTANITAAVRSSLSPSHVSAVFSIPTVQVGTLSPRITELKVPLTAGQAIGASGYTLYTGAAPLGQGLDPNGRQLYLTAYNGTTFDIVADLPDGSSVSDEHKKIGTAGVRQNST